MTANGILLELVQRLPALRAGDRVQGRQAHLQGPAKEMFRLHPDQHGWERFGQDHSGGLPNGTPIAPFMEGAWMTKVAGTYYLQYGAPGTEYNAYATAPTPRNRRSARGPMRRGTRSPTSPAALSRGRARFDLRGQSRQLVETPARRGSAPTGRSSGGSTCSRRSSRRTGRCGRPRASATSRTGRRRGRSTTSNRSSPAGCCCPTASNSRPPRRSASMRRAAPRTRIRAASGSRGASSRARR
ncbi:hypothetical protein DdX_19875 [Ditylenchus destructor]|uniref:Uncharacterized protein n=1 Tax=Ditylenchus destructor TaxID=166010 RepID=A0AAD4MH76_9BILA|nr:hypothetical protein DdX_19875 [Ditylenchus destructor]